MEMLVVLLMLTSTAGQGYTLQVGPPVAGNAPLAKNAVFVVRPGDCPDPTAAQISAKAEGLVNGARRSVPLSITALPTRGVHAVKKEWPDGGNWIVNVVVACAGKTNGALVTLGPKNSYRRDGVQLVAHAPTEQEIDASLKALTGGQR
jgi:hypothetical protein